jgi:hypothetical protein
MSESEMQAELERLRVENAQLKGRDNGDLTMNAGLLNYSSSTFTHALERLDLPLIL